MNKAQRTYLGYLWTTILNVGAILLAASMASAATYTFQGFPGGWSPSFFEQTAVVPCHAGVSVKLSGSRIDHHDSDVPITIEFRAPGISLQSPPTNIEVFQARAANTQTQSFSVPGHSSGCGSPWRVRIVPYAGATREGKIIGDLGVSFDGSVANLNLEDAALLPNRGKTTKNIGGSNGLHQGWIEITGTWNHSLYGVPGPMPVKLTFELLKPNGDIAAFDTGHSNHEINPCCSGDKMKLRFLVRENISGQWKVRITNDSGQDAMTIIPKATFKPACF